MLNIHNLSISFQGEYLFEEITFKLGNGDRIGLIGKNGAGKSTMLRILSKEQEPDILSLKRALNLSIAIGGRSLFEPMAQHPLLGPHHLVSLFFGFLSIRFDSFKKTHRRSKLLLSKRFFIESETKGACDDEK